MVGTTSAFAAEPSPLAGIRRVVFLGDSITYSGGYIEFIEADLRLRDPSLQSELLNLGLPSETVSGLSEPGHAGGAFPRPDLHERLDRVLEKTRPDLIVACYGMNDGIYHPFDEGRLAKFQDGLRSLRRRAAGAGVKVLHITPPVFDPVPIEASSLPAGLAEYRRPFVGYDEVLGRYSEWLLSRRRDGWDVVDIHQIMARHLARERQLDPKYRLAADGVHINATGHLLIARQVLAHWGVPTRAIDDAEDAEQAFSARPHGLEVLELVRRRQRLLKDAWLTETGHKRPGMTSGLPLDEATRRAGEIGRQLRALLSPEP
jgi:lysophospholipase L1-like esterase